MRQWEAVPSPRRSLSPFLHILPPSNDSNPVRRNRRGWFLPPLISIPERESNSKLGLCPTHPYLGTHAHAANYLENQFGTTNEDKERILRGGEWRRYHRQEQASTTLLSFPYGKDDLLLIERLAAPNALMIAELYRIRSLPRREVATYRLEDVSHCFICPPSPPGSRKGARELFC